MAFLGSACCVCATFIHEGYMWSESRPSKQATALESTRVPNKLNPLFSVGLDSNYRVEQRRLPCHPTKLCRSAVKTHVLRTYTTTAPISSFIDLEGETLTETSRAKMRAERLDAGSGSTNTQSELIAHVEGLNSDLNRHWQVGERVRSLRVTIQAVKMLNIPKFPVCYPSIFMLVSVVMDTFGDFVAKRLQDLAANNSMLVAALLKKGQDASADIIPPEAVEICTNWFLKISSIRELLPRICIELALLKTSNYVSKKMRVNPKDVVARLVGQITGIADPIVCSHIRWYLFMRSAEVLRGKEWAAVLEPALVDQLQCMQTHAKSSTLYLVAPAFQWMLDTVLTHGRRDRRHVVLSQCLDVVLPLRCSALSSCLIRSMSTDELVAHVDALVEHVGGLPLDGKIEAIRVLCLALAQAFSISLSKGQRTALLSQLYGFVSVGDIPVLGFIEAMEGMLHFSCSHLGSKQVHMLLRLLREKVTAAQNSLYEEPLKEAMSSLASYHDASLLISSPDFLPLLSLIEGSKRRDAIHHILLAVPSQESLAGFGLEMCRLLEQSLASSEDSDDGYMFATICRTLTRVAPTEIDSLVAFLCEARHTLSDQMDIRSTLIYLALRAARREGLKSHRRAQVKVLFAFAHATLPALVCPFRRAKIALECASAAFSASYVSQGEGLLQFTVSTLQHFVPTSTLRDGTVVSNDTKILAVLHPLISIGAVVPAHATFGHLYLQHATLKWLCEYRWPAASSDRIKLLCAVALVATASGRGSLQYSYKHCGTRNYLSDSTFIEQCAAVAELALGKALFFLNKAMHDPIQHVAAQEASEVVFNCAVACGNLSGEAILHAAASFAIQVATNVAALWVGKIPSTIGGVLRSELSLESASRLIFSVDGASLKSTAAAAVADELDSIEAALEEEAADQTPPQPGPDEIAEEDIL